MTRIRNAMLVAPAVLAIAGPFTAYEEGLRTKVYLDSVGVPTYCRGETENPDWTKTYTVQECDNLFYAKLGAYSYAVQVSVGLKMKPEFHAALTSWTYNVGPGAMRGSTLIKYARQGDFVAACNQLPRWKFAGGKPILANRRERERNLCLKGT